MGRSFPRAISGNNHLFHQGALVKVSRSKWYNDMAVITVMQCIHSYFCQTFFHQKGVPACFSETTDFHIQIEGTHGVPTEKRFKTTWGWGIFVPFSPGITQVIDAMTMKFRTSILRAVFHCTARLCPFPRALLT